MIRYRYSPRIPFPLVGKAQKRTSPVICNQGHAISIQWRDKCYITEADDILRFDWQNSKTRSVPWKFLQSERYKRWSVATLYNFRRQTIRWGACGANESEHTSGCLSPARWEGPKNEDHASEFWWEWIWTGQCQICIQITVYWAANRKGVSSHCKKHKKERLLFAQIEIQSHKHLLISMWKDQLSLEHAISKLILKQSICAHIFSNDLWSSQLTTEFVMKKIRRMTWRVINIHTLHSASNWSLPQDIPQQICDILVHMWKVL